MIKGDFHMNIKKAAGLLAFLLLVAGGRVAQAQDAKAAEHRTIAQVMDRGVSGVEGEFVPAAEAMPEDKYSFAPTGGEFKGVRTFAQQVKHVAAVNYMIGASILEEKPPVELGGENGPDSVKTKADAVKFLKESFAYAHKAVATLNEGNLVTPIKSPFGEGMTTRLGMATLIVGHCFDHYGQMVEYLRMNNIVPPASR
jgi:DinB superfamily